MVIDMNCYDITQETVLGENPRVRILNTVIDVLTMEETVKLVEKYINRKIPLHLMGVNADKINGLNNNELMKKIVNSCGVINADGASVVLASKFLGKKLPERVAGIDLMLRLVEVAAKKNYSVFLLGAKQEVVECTKNELERKYPELDICGIHNGYFNEDYWGSIAALLKEKKPDLVFVGITSPIKEYLIEYLQNEGCACVFMGVGGSFDVISGKIPRAPLWMQKNNLEWLFRVIQEPRRLFKRYMIGNLIFIKRVIGAKVRD